MKSKVMIQVADRRLEVSEHEIPPVAEGQALLRVEACGLCGSDVEQYKGGFVQKGLVRYPVIPGHEPVGILEEVDPVAAQRWGVQKGDRVALEPLISCGRCELCLGGTYHLCKSVFDVAAPAYGYLPLDFGHGLWGGYSEFIHLHERTILHRVPDNLPPEIATMYQALAAGIRWAVDIPNARFRDKVLVLGCGQRGLAAVVALKAAGVEQVIITGLSRDKFKLDLARSLGASDVITVDSENTIDRVMALTGGRGVDMAIDLVPASTVPINDAIECVRIGGTVVLAGIKGGDRKASIDTDRLLYKEITLRGVFAQGADAYEAALDVLSKECERLTPMHTHEVGLEDAARGIEMVAGEVAGEEAICVSIHP